MELTDTSADLASLMAKFVKSGNLDIQNRIAQFVSRKTPLFRGDLVGTKESPATSAVGIAETVKHGSPWYNLDLLSSADSYRLLRFAAHYGHRDLALDLIDRGTGLRNIAALAIAGGNYALAKEILKAKNVITDKDIDLILDTAVDFRGAVKFLQTDADISDVAIIGSIQRTDERQERIMLDYFEEVVDLFPARFGYLAAEFGYEPVNADKALRNMTFPMFKKVFSDPVLKRRAAEAVVHAEFVPDEDGNPRGMSIRDYVEKLRFLAEVPGLQHQIAEALVRPVHRGPMRIRVLLEWNETDLVKTHWKELDQSMNSFWHYATAAEYYKIRDIVGKDPTYGDWTKISVMPVDTLGAVVGDLDEIQFEDEIFGGVERKMAKLRTKIGDDKMKILWSKSVRGLTSEFSPSAFERIRTAALG